MQMKKGVSLIVLVITIIVMIILAGTIVLSLNSTDIMDRAEEAVDKTNLSTIQQLASTLWTDAYLDGKTEQPELKEAVINGLTAQGINTSDYKITVTTKGVKVIQIPTTLGALVASAENYGDTVNYTVTVNAITIDDWKVFYKQTVEGEEYVYLIASERLAINALPTGLSGSGATVNEQGGLYWPANSAPTNTGTIENPKMWMAEWGNYDSYSTNYNGRCVSYALDERYWEQFKNTTKYGDSVVGAIGTPTLEMFVASWNAKGAAKNDTTTYIPLTLTANVITNVTTGYYINAGSYEDIGTADDLYVWSTSSGTGVYLASPGGSDVTRLMYISNTGRVDDTSFYNNATFGLRPVVCFKSSTPAHAGTASDATDIVLE